MMLGEFPKEKSRLHDRHFQLPVWSLPFFGKHFSFYTAFWFRRGEVSKNDSILRYTNIAKDIVYFVIEHVMGRARCTREIEEKCLQAFDGET
jgi:hypothetical protein